MGRHSRNSALALVAGDIEVREEGKQTAAHEGKSRVRGGLARARLRTLGFHWSACLE